MLRFDRRIAFACALALALLDHATARAWDPFEIEVFHPQVLPQGQAGLELHNNYTARGDRLGASPTLPTDQVLHEMVDARVGLTDNVEIGGHVLVAVRGHEARTDFAGARVRAQWRAGFAVDSPIQFGINVELSVMPRAYDAGIATIELRPIPEWSEANFHLDFNPTLVTPLAGSNAGVPTLEPSVAARYRIFAALELSIEYYPSTGPITRMPRVRDQDHYLVEALTLVRWPTWSVRFGVGEGLTWASDSLTLNFLVGHIF